jgi:hypothetical protein
MENSIMTINEAKEVLRKAGYFVDNLWHIRDVIDRYECDEETAMEVLDSALTNDATMEQIHFAINLIAEDLELKQHEE